MFEYLNSYRIILVVGPMRSGTTILAHMIAADTGKPYLDDAELGDNMSDPDKVRQVVYSGVQAVVQAPGMTYYITEFSGFTDVAIVMLRRDVQEIWDSTGRSASQYHWSVNVWLWETYPEYRNTGIDLVQAIYWHWDNVQKRQLLNAYEINYNDLKSHPLWLNKEEREYGWGLKSWER